jgi:hypothetical protein
VSGRYAWLIAEQQQKTDDALKIAGFSALIVQEQGDFIIK